MNQFTADIAGMLELFAIAAGLVLLHRASKEAPGRLLKLAGWVLVVGGIGVGACTTFYWLKYESRGEFDTVHMGDPRHAPGTSMGPRAMGSGTPGQGMATTPHGMTPWPDDGGR